MRPPRHFTTVVIILWAVLGGAAAALGQKAELMVQTGHGGSVRSVAFSPDGRYLASSSHDRTIKIWNVSTGLELRTLTGHNSSIAKVAFSPLGQLLASAGTSDDTVRLWKYESGEQWKVLQGVTQWNLSDPEFADKEQRGYYESVTDVTFSPDGKLVASCNYKAIKLWDAGSGRLLRTLINHTDWIYSIVFTADGKRLVSAGRDKTIRITDIATGRVLQNFEDKTLGEMDRFLRVSLSPDGGTIAATDGSKITLWDITTGLKSKELVDEAHSPETVMFLPDGRLVSGGLDGTVRLWELPAGRASTLTEHTKGVEGLAFSAKHGLLASSGEDKEIRFYNVARGALQKVLSGKTSRVLKVDFAHRAPLLAVAFNDSIIKLWHLTERECRTFDARSRSAPNPENAFSEAFLEYQYGGVIVTAFSPDDRLLATGNRDIKMWDVASGKVLWSHPTEDVAVLSFAFSPDGEVLASNSLPNGVVRLWDVKTGRELKSLKGHESPVPALTFSPSGKLLASGSGDNTIRLWDVASGQELAALKGHTDTVQVVAFSSDGEKLLSLADDETARVWDVSARRQIASFKMEDPEVGQKVRQLIPQLKEDDHSVYDAKFHIKGDGKGSTYLIDARTGKQLITLFRLGDEWAAITPDGLFDASPEGRSLLHYVIGLEPISLGQMKELYYVPGLLTKVINGDPLPAVELFSAKDLFPLAQFDRPKPDQQSFPIKLTNRGGGIGPVQVIVNGKEFIGDARPAGFDPNQPAATLQINLAGAPLLAGEVNRVEVVTHNIAGSLSSRGSARGSPISAVFNYGARVEPPHVYAIIGGVSNYTGDNLALSFAAKDAAAFATAFELGARRLFGAANVHIRLLTSDGDKSTVKFQTVDAKVSSATKADFERAFADFQTATPNDIFVIYLAGHGVSLNLSAPQAQAGGDTYLYLTQEAVTTDKAVLAVDNSRRAMAISSDELAEWMKQNKALKQVLVLDTCAAGAAAASLIAKRDLPSDQIRAIERLKDRTGFFALMGAAADKVSYEASRYGQGLLTYSLLQGLKGAKLRDGQYADVWLLFEYAQDTVPEIAKNIGGIQRPLIIAPEIGGSPDKVSGSFDIGRFTPDEQRLIALTTPRPLVLKPSLQNRAVDYDDLGLTPLLRQALHNASYVSARGQPDPPLVFVEADEMVDAFKPSGSYLVEGDNVTVTIRLIRNNVPVETLTVSGKAGDKETLVKQIVAAITRAPGVVK